MFAPFVTGNVASILFVVESEPTVSEYCKASVERVETTPQLTRIDVENTNGDGRPVTTVPTATAGDPTAHAVTPVPVTETVAVVLFAANELIEHPATAVKKRNFAIFIVAILSS